MGTTELDKALTSWQFRMAERGCGVVVVVVLGPVVVLSLSCIQTKEPIKESKMVSNAPYLLLQLIANSHTGRCTTEMQASSLPVPPR